MIKLLFLDIDWVLNTFKSECDLCDELIQNLFVLLNKFPDIKIIISSDWKYDTIKLHLDLERKQIKLPIIDYTHKSLIYNIKETKNIHNIDELRAKEIKLYLDYYNKEFNYNIKYFIFDDYKLHEHWLDKNFSKVNSMQWLSLNNIDDAINYFNT